MWKDETIPAAENALGAVRKNMPEEALLCELAELYKVFGDSTRVKILSALLRGELRVCDIARLLDMSPSAISHQLRFLRSSRLVKCRRDGKTAYYALADDHVRTILDMGMEHLSEK